MGKHAYLIIANRNPNQLNLLLNTLDDSRNDIYLLIDKKSINKFYNIFKPMYSSLYMIDPIDIYWGNYSQISAELKLFASSKDGNYDYYHLLSGLDLPLVNQDVIHNFFDAHLNKEFITYSATLSPTRLAMRLHKYHFDDSFRTTNKMMLYYHKLEMMLYSKLPQHRVSIDKITFGSNWVSLDQDLINSLVGHQEMIYDIFHNGFLVDELFIPIFINMFPRYKDKLYYSTPVNDRPNEFQGNLRYINWWDGSPYVWKEKDYPILQKAIKMGHLFSRKFDENIDINIINKIVEKDIE